MNLGSLFQRKNRTEFIFIKAKDLHLQPLEFFDTISATSFQVVQSFAKYGNEYLDYRFPRTFQ